MGEAAWGLLDAPRAGRVGRGQAQWWDLAPQIRLPAGPAQVAPLGPEVGTAAHARPQLQPRTSHVARPTPACCGPVPSPAPPSQWRSACGAPPLPRQPPGPLAAASQGFSKRPALTPTLAPPRSGHPLRPEPSGQRLSGLCLQGAVRPLGGQRDHCRAPSAEPPGRAGLWTAGMAPGPRVAAGGPVTALGRHPSVLAEPAPAVHRPTAPTGASRLALSLGGEMGSERVRGLPELTEQGRGRDGPLCWVVS